MTFLIPPFSNPYYDNSILGYGQQVLSCSAAQASTLFNQLLVFSQLLFMSLIHMFLYEHY